ncbi:biotin/lipoyl-containing protein, partial [Acidihalobacter prosperus]
MAELKEIYVPDIGDFKSVEVIEVLVNPGDTISPDSSLITLESDKASMEIPSPEGGVVRELKVKVGDQVAQGSPILVLEPKAAGDTGASTSDKTPAASSPDDSSADTETVTPQAPVESTPP